MSTFDELKAEVCEEIGSINVTDDATKLGRFLNRGVRDFLRRTHCYVESDTFTPAAAANYSLDSTALVVIDMYWTASTSALERVTVAELLRIRRAGLTGTGYPHRYAFQHPLIMFDFAPTGTDSLTCVNVPAPTVMSSDSHDPSTATYGGIPVDYHDALAYYAEWHLASYADDASASQGTRYMEWYLARVKTCKQELRERGGRRQAKSRFGMTSRRLVPANNSTDY